MILVIRGSLSILAQRGGNVGFCCKKIWCLWDLHYIEVVLHYPCKLILYPKSHLGTYRMHTVALMHAEMSKLSICCGTLYHLWMLVLGRKDCVVFLESVLFRRIAELNPYTGLRLCNRSYRSSSFLIDSTKCWTSLKQFFCRGIHRKVYLNSPIIGSDKFFLVRFCLG